MRRSWLRTLILGLVLGPVPAPDTAELEPADREELSSRRAKGQVVVGADFLVWDEDARTAEAWAAELARGAGAPSSWRDVARRSAGLPAVLGDEVVDEMASWSEAPGEHEAAGLLGFVLCLLPSLDRTYLVSSWATSPNEGLRRDLAHALAAPFEAPGVRSAIEHLREDPSAEVRRLAAVAAERRRHLRG